MTTQLPPDRLALPPPRARDLIDDNDRLVGWIARDTVGFVGFATAVEAAHAAWVAYRTMARRLARLHGSRPMPIDSEPLTIERRGERDVVLASGRLVATLMRPGAESRSGPDAFGFAIRVPSPTDEVRMHALAHLMYRALRRSGLRWALWRAVPEPVVGGAAEPSSTAHAAHHASDVTSDLNAGGTRDVTDRSGQRAWRLPSLPWRRAGRLDRGPRDRAIGIRAR